MVRSFTKFKACIGESRRVDITDSFDTFDGTADPLHQVKWRSRGVAINLDVSHCNHRMRVADILYFKEGFKFKDARCMKLLLLHVALVTTVPVSVREWMARPGHLPHRSVKRGQLGAENFSS
ncbi:hypothetical protein RRG08_005562 [Elysia crispata]|uniref:Uncharacterized protein n=1 Tax=Elysia crispata TaxID=231223 RepID=A0AAE1ALL6_9GAST|nr:hypothetical protein RRG08_005562 [Elysia crispata]